MYVVCSCQPLVSSYPRHISKSRIFRYCEYDIRHTKLLSDEYLGKHNYMLSMKSTLFCYWFVGTGSLKYGATHYQIKNPFFNLISIYLVSMIIMQQYILSDIFIMIIEMHQITKDNLNCLYNCMLSWNSTLCCHRFVVTGNPRYGVTDDWLIQQIYLIDNLLFWIIGSQCILYLSK